MNEIRDIHQPFCRWLDKRGIPFHKNRPDKKTTAIKGDPDFLRLHRFASDYCNGDGVRVRPKPLDKKGPLRVEKV